MARKLENKEEKNPEQKREERRLKKLEADKKARSEHPFFNRFQSVDSPANSWEEINRRKEEFDISQAELLEQETNEGKFQRNFFLMENAETQAAKRWLDQVANGITNAKSEKDFTVKLDIVYTFYGKHDCYRRRCHNALIEGLCSGVKEISDAAHLILEEQLQDEAFGVTFWIKALGKTDYEYSPKFWDLLYSYTEKRLNEGPFYAVRNGINYYLQQNPGRPLYAGEKILSF